MKRLDLVVGPNGAGKSTFIELTLAGLLPGSLVVNADVIARQRWPDAAEAHSYDAARIAADTRAALIRTGRPFIAETVFSHPSKLDLIATAREAGYTVALHALLIPEELATHRVRLRVVAGGHDVPEDKVRARYRRLWSNVARAIELCDLATAYDNSRVRGPRVVAQFSQGIAYGSVSWPKWCPPELTSRWPG